MLYQWLKVGHILFVIFWMSGLFMLPRYFVYHQESEAGSAEEARWVDREAKLLKIILWPSLVLVWAFGLALAKVTGAFSHGWFDVKLLFVLGLTFFHIWLAGYAHSLAAGERRLTGKRLRLLNEVPGLAAVVIVVMVVLKPF